MTRDEWLDGFTERLRNVLQKHEREREVHKAAEFGDTRPGEVQRIETHTDAAIDELGRFVLDATQRSIHFEPPVIASPLHPDT